MEDVNPRVTSKGDVAWFCVEEGALFYCYCYC